ncbi:hypothetical protein [Flavobacterium psychrotolerans]|uniref:Uncharacterized protein n=1 Tax=Flavobacterium psychrotolerans TaxID=2169410 RepID=A0A2U1JGH4_9FLAO|nr:hypothetical protein [Flavobacterium psychrotolerans]PWA04109.1 hypothetical protein DB895_12555 [Flavobacterium psychrotolerans]
MKKTDLLIGALIGIITSAIGSYLFMEFFTGYTFIEGIQIMKFEGKLGKIITLGSILNIAIFFILLKFDKEIMARGVVLGTLILTIITLFV